MEHSLSLKSETELHVSETLVKPESRMPCNKPPSNVSATFVPAYKCEAMDTSYVDRLTEGESSTQTAVDPTKGEIDNSDQGLTLPSTLGRTGVESAGKQQGSGSKSAMVREIRIIQASSSRMKSLGSLHGLISPEFASLTATPTSVSQLIPLSSSALFTLEGLDFSSPVGSGQFSPLTSARIGRKRQLSISPLSSSSIDLSSLIRTSPTSLVNYITNSRSSSAGSIGHLSPSMFNNQSLFQTANGRPLQLSLRNTGYPLPSTSASQLRGTSESTSQNQHTRSSSKEETDGNCKVTVKEEQMEHFLLQENLPTILPMSGNGVKMKLENGTLLLQRESTSQQMTLSLETVQEESVGGLGPLENERQHIDINNSSTVTEQEYEADTKRGILDDKPKRVYYNYSSVEEPHHNQCKWADCRHQCDKLDSLVHHVNNEHIYRDSRKEFICHWIDCVREKKPFKAQYMLLVHMRRHTGEKPHKCTYEGCNKAYSRLENLKTHLRSHTGERPYVCKYEGCLKTFSNASDCAKHMNRTHTDDKPYTCPNPGCTKRYTDPSSRRKHTKNCQVSKRARTEDHDATPAASEMDTLEVASRTRMSLDSKRTSKSRKSEKKKGNVTNAPVSRTLTQDHLLNRHSQPVSGIVTDHGYFSGGSQSQASSSQMTYNSPDYDRGYASLHGDEEISLILQKQRLSDPSDIATTMHQQNQGYVPTNQIGLSNHVTPNVRASRQSGRESSIPAGSIHLTPPPLLFNKPLHIPSHTFQSPHLEYSHLVQPPQSSPLHSLTHNQTVSNQHTSHLTAFHHNQDRMNLYRAQKRNHTTSTGYSNFRSYSPPKAGIASGRKSPGEDSSVISSSLRSSNLTNSYSTFSSSSSRVSSPCSNSERSDMLRPQSLIPNYNHGGFSNGNLNLHAQVNQLDSANAGYPLKQSLKMMNSFLPKETYRRRQSSDSYSQRSSLYSSHSSRYSFSGSETGNDLLESLPTGFKRESFARMQPLPLPESMQEEFIAIDHENLSKSPNVTIDPLSSQCHDSNDMSAALYFDHSRFDYMDQSNSDPLSTSLTLPLHHFDGSNNLGIGPANCNSFSDYAQGGHFSQEHPGDDCDMIFSDLGAGSSSNMIVGDMSSFANTLPEENQYLEHLISSQVK